LSLFPAKNRAAKAVANPNPALTANQPVELLREPPQLPNWKRRASPTLRAENPDLHLLHLGKRKSAQNVNAVF
jgi:hypothetical protein